MKKPHREHGVWKVAYADFTTAMMALFLCLWLTSQDQKIKDAVERAFRNPFSSVTKESVGIIPSADANATYQQQGHFQSVSAVEMETMRHLSDDLSKLLKQDENVTSVKIELTPEGLDINIFDRSRKPIFNPGTARFTDYGSWVFSTLAWEVSRYTTFRIELEGHTESKKENGTAARDGWDLSTDRANAARRVLAENGVLEKQFSKISGFADRVPMAGYAPTDEINRRVTVLLKLKESVNAVSSTPDVDRPTDLPNDTR
ncbi:MAG TPA: flagellar motor protein MotB [Verrucomicrobiae bacterium]|jgi:chemotaxis protein MotB|nr:flagellar motor protein MotB [Verrucomicrobiae bacterium]